MLDRDSKTMKLIDDALGVRDQRIQELEAGLRIIFESWDRATIGKTHAFSGSCGGNLAQAFAEHARKYFSTERQ